MYSGSGLDDGHGGHDVLNQVVFEMMAKVVYEQDSWPRGCGGYCGGLLGQPLTHGNVETLNCLEQLF